MTKKIWIWNHYATSQYRRKMGRHYWFAKNLQALGYEPTVFSANTFHGGSEPSIDTGKSKYRESQAGSIPFVLVKTKEAVGNSLDRILNMLGFYWNLFSVSKLQVKKNGKPDLILASSVHPLTMVAGIQIGKKMKVPVICEVRDLWPEAIFQFTSVEETSLLGKLLVKGEHWIYKNADALIFTKEGDTDYIKEKKWDRAQGGDIDLTKAYYINNGLDLEAFEKGIKKYTLSDTHLENNKFTVTYVGSLRPVNDVTNIVQAAKILRDEKDIQFLIYGEGSEEKKITAMIEEANLENIHLKGYVEKKYIPYILNHSSVNLLNYSRTKYNWSRGNSSNKLFEYMASGKPIISNVEMGYSIIRKYECGIELKTGDAKDLAQAILAIKDLPEAEYQLMGANGRAGAMDFDFKYLTSKLMEIIGRLS